jgi:cytochrome c peroxidase
MKKVCLFALCGMVAGAMVVTARTAYAVAAFRKEFETKYVNKEPSTDAEKSLLAVVKKAKCNVCHLGKKKKERNAYGVALSEELTKKDSKNKEKIRAALEKVADMKSDPDDPGSPTFGQRIQQGELPAGDPATAEPATAEAAATATAGK